MSSRLAFVDLATALKPANMGIIVADLEDACARRFSISEVVIHEQRGRRLGQGGRDLSDVESACVDGSLVHIRFCEFGRRRGEGFSKAAGWSNRIQQALLEGSRQSPDSAAGQPVAKNPPRWPPPPPPQARDVFGTSSSSSSSTSEALR